MGETRPTSQEESNFLNECRKHEKIGDSCSVSQTRWIHLMFLAHLPRQPPKPGLIHSGKEGCGGGELWAEALRPQQSSGAVDLYGDEFCRHRQRRGKGKQGGRDPALQTPGLPFLPAL